MSGTVHEWMDDAPRVYAGAPVVDPHGGDGAERAVRGGGWNDNALSAGVAARSRFAQAARLVGLGFRLARSLPPAPPR